MRSCRRRTSKGAFVAWHWMPVTITASKVILSVRMLSTCSRAWSLPSTIPKPNCRRFEHTVEVGQSTRTGNFNMPLYCYITTTYSDLVVLPTLAIMTAGLLDRLTFLPTNIRWDALLKCIYVKFHIDIDMMREIGKGFICSYLYGQPTSTCVKTATRGENELTPTLKMNPGR